MSNAEMAKRFKYGPSQDYELLEFIEADGEIPVYNYVNKITGLKIFLGYVESPLVKADLAFATEAHDDDGLPHTLEHLVFMGTESYPYKGLLDLLANQSFSDGTNAMTETDFTSYELVTAGSEGFLNLLPIFLDHLFFASLTDDAYLTEVHHINGRGEDAGVVYCEMQARENSGDSRCELEMVRQMYPGICGYKSNTGGMLKDIRTSLNNEKIKKYHAQYYVPSNFCMVITGPVRPEALFEAIKPIEDKLHQKFSDLPPITRPWSSEVPPLEKNVNKTIQYPCDSAEDGIVYLGYRGPNCENFIETIAVSLLMDYLNQPSVSPFQKELVECENPYCSSIDETMVENRVTHFYFSFESVQMELISKLEDKVNEILSKIVSGEEEFDVNRLKVIISRRKVNLLLSCERNPHSLVLNASLSHFLYGEGSMKDKFQTNKILDELMSVDKSYWLNLIERYMIGPESKRVCINGEPSPELLATMTKEEEDRIQQQKESLGEKLELKEASLKRAKENHDKPIPNEMLNMFPLPSVDDIKFHHIQTLDPDDNRLPFTVRYDLIKTNFVAINFVMDTSHCLNADQRMYIPLLRQLIFESPLMRDGKLISHEQVVQELFTDTISIDISTGVGGGSSNLLVINFQIEKENYGKSVNWINEILFATQFPVERIKTIVKRMIGDISQMKRDGDQITKSATISLIYKNDSMIAAENFTKQQVFLKSLLKKLKTNPEVVQNELTNIRDKITSTPKYMYAHLSLGEKNFPNQDLIFEPWFEFLPKKSITTERFEQAAIIQNCDLVSLEEDIVSGLIIENGSVESAYLQQIIPSIRDPHHKDLAKILVIIEYFIQLEGPLWRQLRGEGLTYSYHMGLRAGTGLMYLSISRSTQLVDAYKRFAEVILGQLENEIPFEEHLLKSAKSCLVYHFIAREKHPFAKSAQSLAGYLTGVGANYDRVMLSKVADVTNEDLHRVGKQYLTPLFKGTTRRAAGCCHPSKLDQILTGLNQMGCQLKSGSVELLASLDSKVE